MVKNNCKIINSFGVAEDNFSSKLMDWRYTIMNKEMYQVKELTCVDDFQQQQQLKQT